MNPKLQTLYPLSTQEGVAVPFEVVQPIGCLMEDFTDSSSPVRTLVTVDCILAIYANKDLLIKFGGQAAVVPADGTYDENLIFVPKYTVYTVSPVSEKLAIVAANTGESGRCFINLLTRWISLVSTEKLYQRK